jgi:hypothetical protein
MASSLLAALAAPGLDLATVFFVMRDLLAARVVSPVAIMDTAPPAPRGREMR